MADTYGTVPHSAFADERNDGDDGSVRAFMSVVMTFTDDDERFEGDPRAFAVLMGGASVEYVEWGFAELEQRGWIVRYEVPGRKRRVGRVVDYFKLEGHPYRKANPSQRTKSYLPREDGTFFEGRSKSGASEDANEGSEPSQATRKQRATTAQVSRKSDASKPQATSKQNASEAQATRKQRATTAQDRREEKRSEQISSPKGEERSVHVAPVTTPASVAPSPPGGDAGVTGIVIPPGWQPVPPGHYRHPDGHVLPLAKQGTPEWDDAERRGDWKALGWA